MVVVLLLLLLLPPPTSSCSCNPAGDLLTRPSTGSAIAARLGHLAAALPCFNLVRYALLVGGAATHRLDLSNMVMLKDNHIWSAGSITKAVQHAKTAAGFTSKIEVEARTPEEAIEAASAGADIVMLDNMAPEVLKESAAALKAAFPHLTVEASGGITLETMPEYFSPNVDVISRGSLTQGYGCIDFSLKILQQQKP
uniref:Nicotinate-nucleotide pyrophosphorylase [carboxylating] n=1 Tax=Rhizochromulina marina TaxID=1034831 RepID=A0A7S2WRU5_9STRA